MGIEYTPKFGIGLKIVSVNGFTQEQEDDEDGECFSDLLDDTGVAYIETGNWISGGEKSEFFAIIEDPFEWGFDLSAKIFTFKELLAANNIVTEGEINLVGGLKIW